MLDAGFKIVLTAILVIVLVQAFDRIDKQMKFDRCLGLYTAFSRSFSDVEKYADTNCGNILRKALND